MNPTEAQALIDKMEAAVQRIRNLDAGLKNALVADMDRLRVMIRSVDALDRLAENAQELGLGY
jgi:hypothetical protein